MAEFFAELKRRQMFRVAAVYAVVAWLLLQVVNNLTPGLNLPTWVATSVIVVLALGFPVALIFAWIHQLAPADGATARAKASGLDWVLVGGLGIVILLIGYQQIAPTQQSGVDAAREAAQSPATGISLAVLPFANLSDDPSQEFFSDGITEEITSTLARVPDLRVVARTSAFEFKGQNRNIQSIGQQLNATHLIEGSVRKAGDRVRITVQLIKAGDGTNIWSENYDRQLTDIFAIQEGIARAVATSFNMRLGLQSGDRLVNQRARDPASYEDYLRAKGLIRTRDPRRITEAITRLEQSAARDPEFAPAWGLLGYAYGQLALNQPARLTGDVDNARAIVESSSAKALQASQRAIQLDPMNPDGYVALAGWHNRRGERLLGLDLNAKALALDPDYPESLNGMRVQLATLGYLKQALPISQKLVQLEPFVPAFLGVHARILFANNKTDEAVAIFESRIPGPALVEYYAAQGRYSDAVSLLESFRTNSFVTENRSISDQLEASIRLLRNAPKSTDQVRTLPALGNQSYIYLHVGAPQRVLDYYESSLKAGFYGGADVINLWSPPYRPVRQTARFKEYVRSQGMIEYWRARGWPDLCRPTTGDDFV